MTTDRADAPPLPRPAPDTRPTRRPSTGPAAPARPARTVPRWAVPALLAAADALAAAGAAALAGVRDPALLAPLVPLLLLLTSRAGLYRPGPAATALDELAPLLGRAATGWCAVAAGLAALRPGQHLGPAALASAIAGQVVLAAAGRAAVHRARRAAARRRPRSALLVGPEPAARQLAAALLAHPEYGLRPVGVVPAGPAAPDGAPAGAVPPRLRSAEALTRAVIRHTVRDAVFLLLPESDPYAAALLRRFQGQGAAIWLAGPGAARDGRPPAPGTGHLWGFPCRPLETAAPRRGGAAKRALDVLLASAALLATAPLLLGCALAVRCADGPGVLSRRERTGRDGRRFALLRLRTARPGARPGPVGRWLRRTGLDGLPQLWNVLRGDLSLVGPRPERPARAAEFARRHPGYAARHRMPPGITGLAQVHGLREGAPAEDRARFDNLYIDSWSPGQDLLILLRAAARRLRGREGG
ncbi:sugar transferase [Streptomyces sp. RS10V-4]|uniref:sugar transferase n=1 Tax=Streptomyces rhizoryzae TaxID=2932493 RepID=UPI002002F3BE|nr:sugar transferase [Streptomyces rhizoryzae]MCK7625320.1 sugar transferase [Streptomyces rhizoryzae]